MTQRYQSVALTLALALLTACGGGGGTSSNASSSGGNSQAVITPYVPSAPVLAAKQTNYPTAFAGSVGNGSGCSNVTNTTAYVLPNSITYAANGVGEAAQQQIAEYSEQAIGEIRTALGLAATTGFNGSRVHICAQTQLVLGSADGAGSSTGFVVVSSDSSNINNAYLVNNFSLYKKLAKHELVHTYQLATLQAGANFARADSWFTEGLAEYIASGKSSKTKSEIMAMVAMQNPVAVISTGFSTNFIQYYPAFQSTVAYLFDAAGAKNNIFVLPAFLALINTKTAALNASCVGASCSTTSEDGFKQAFEATFKEADGTTPMKLRSNSGANNLQDTIATRLTNFLN
jgi:hypothetical protein